ncbi:hypothetical protein BHYA_0019g00110 [Botrytis hyacinthi]|uniref:Uncharacterized protein n=1 Tax=Botrytis hyacinthi TaxID=278943 RepID=A0A4Z1H1S2_9HELO|nr:hypothetical protein BHYA_0019g00110 [Botrytis hyacinthi]
MIPPVSVGVEKRDEDLCNIFGDKNDMPYCCPLDAQDSKTTYNIISYSDVSKNTTLTNRHEFKKFCKY